MTHLRWGLLSTAHINRRLIPAIRASHQSHLIAVASRNLESARRYADEWHIPHAFSSYAEMLASDLIDVVYVSLPNHLHAEWSIRALEAGKHVLCEKPFALSVAETDRMIAASLKADMKLLEAFMYRFHPQTALVLDMVQSGKIGRVFHVYGEFTFKHSRGEDYRLIPEQGGGSLWDIGVYPLSYAQAVFQQPPLSVFGSQHTGPSGVDMAFSAQLIYGDHRTASLFCSFDTPNSSGLVIYGERGRIEIPRPFAGMEELGYFLLFNEAGTPQKIKFPKKELYLAEVEALEAAILDGKSPPLTLQDTRNHILTVQALFQSAKTASPVHLKEIA
jgi:predicted dehydrogenase